MLAVVITFGCLLISVICNVLFWDRTFGISVPVFAAIITPFLLWFRRRELSKTKTALFILLFILIYLSICAVWYRNGLILCAAIPTIFIGLASIAFTGRKGFSLSNCLGVLESLVKTTFFAIFAAPGVIGEGFNRLTRTGKTSRSAIKVFIGILISIPFLMVFAGLFTSADPFFEKNLQDFLDFIWQPDIFKRAGMIIFMWLLFCGYLARTTKVSSLESHLDRVEPKQNYDGIIIFVFLLMNNILFLAFIIIQLKYLFGGAEVIKNTSFTYAEYAHKGFYEFWATVILVSIIIIYTNYKLREQKGLIRLLVEFAWIAMVCQTFVIIASGFKRIMVYEEAYGYTYLRILVALFLLWMGGVFAIFILKIILKKSHCWLISSGLCLAVVFLLLVSTFSIDKFIARKNIDRYLIQGKELDMEYLSCLSTDAFPEIKRLRKEAKDKDVRQSAKKILSQMSETSENNLRHWASWNLSLSKVER